MGAKYSKNRKEKRNEGEEEKLMARQELQDPHRSTSFPNTSINTYKSSILLIASTNSQEPEVSKPHQSKVALPNQPWTYWEDTIVMTRQEAKQVKHQLQLQ
jgi:hypothetical protein